MSLLPVMFDTTEIAPQIEELVDALKLYFANGALHESIGKLEGLSAGLGLSHDKPTLSADKSCYLIRLRFGRPYNELMATIRTGKWENVAHALAHLKLS